MEVKKMIFGEKIPDKDDPGYKEKHEKTVEAGKNFAKAVKLDKVAMKVQGFASGHPKLFLAFIFGFVLFSIGLNLYRMSTRVCHKPVTCPLLCNLWHKSIDSQSISKRRS